MKRTTKRPSKRPSSEQALVTLVREGNLAHEEIARKAYELWLARGCENGRQDDHWFEAEKNLRTR